MKHVFAFTIMTLLTVILYLCRRCKIKEDVIKMLKDTNIPITTEFGEPDMNFGNYLFGYKVSIVIALLYIIIFGVSVRLILPLFEIIYVGIFTMIVLLIMASIYYDSLKSCSFYQYGMKTGLFFICKKRIHYYEIKNTFFYLSAMRGVCFYKCDIHLANGNHLTLGFTDKEYFINLAKLMKLKNIDVEYYE